MASNPRTGITQLAWEIAFKTDIYNEYLQSQGTPSPSHSLETPALLDLPMHIQQTRDDVIEASTELQTLLRGPMNAIHAQTYQVSVKKFPR
jgi:hypothetical protein